MGSCTTKDNHDEEELVRLRQQHEDLKRQLSGLTAPISDRSALFCSPRADGEPEEKFNFTEGDGVPEFLNQLLNFLWPHISTYVSDLIKTTVEPAVQKALPPKLASIFKFDKAQCNLGTVPIQFPYLGAHQSTQITENGTVKNLLLKASVEWKGDISVLLRLAGMGLGVKSLTLEGQLVIEFVDLIDHPPFYSGMRIYFVNVPTTNLGFQGALAGLNTGVIKRKILDVVEAQISSRLVVPNRIGFTQTPEADIFRIKNPRPQGMLTICVQKAKNLLAMDTVVFGASSSDPFVEILVGADCFKSPTVQKCLNPTFNFAKTVPIFHFTTQVVHLKLFDEDAVGENDFLGLIGLKVADMIQWGEESQEIALEDLNGKAGKNGKVFVTAQWRPLLLELKDKQPDKKGFVFAGVYGASKIKAGAEGTKYWVEATFVDLAEPQIKQSPKCLPALENLSSKAKEEEAADMQRKLEIMRKFGVSTDDMAHVLEVEPDSLNEHTVNDDTKSSECAACEKLIKKARHNIDFNHAFEFHTNNAEKSILTLELKEQAPGPNKKELGPEKSLGSTQVAFDYTSETTTATFELESGACIRVRTQLRYLGAPSTTPPWSLAIH